MNLYALFVYLYKMYMNLYALFVYVYKMYMNLYALFVYLYKMYMNENKGSSALKSFDELDFY
jgi:hypothetical protein